MSFVTVEDYGPAANGVVYGLDESIRRAKYPLAADLTLLGTNMTKGISGLAKSTPGSGHDQWLTGVIVQFDLTFSNKAWVEAERYHFFDFVSSQSTMHRITKFDLDKSYNKYVDPRIISIMKEHVKKYNELYEEYNIVTDRQIKEKLDDMYLQILYSNPAGFLLTAGMTTNYRQLKTIYAQRKTHKLPEWRDFCHWIELLPFSDLITSKI